MANAAEKIKKRKVQRDIEYDKLEDIFNTATKAKTDNKTKGVFEVIVDDIEVIREEFVKHHTALINEIFSDADEVRSATQRVLDFNKKYAEIKSIFNTLFSTGVNTTQQRLSIGGNPSQQPTGGAQSQIKLQEIKLITFEGDIRSFPSFYELFENLVHKNPALSNMAKLTHLVNHLKGPPFEMVTTLPLSGSNYAIAYDKLVKRYLNKRLLANEYWSAIENAPKVNSEDPNALRSLLDTFFRNLEALRELQIDVDGWDYILMQMLLKRVTTDLITRFELFHGKSSEIPRYQVAYDFLDKQCEALFAAQCSLPSLSDKNPQNSSDYRNKTSKFRKSPANNSQKAMFGSEKNVGSTTVSLLCFCCSSDQHLITSCPDFKNKNSKERFNFAKSKSLCILCLNNSHKTSLCKAEIKCDSCKKRHNSLLHFNGTDVSTDQQSERANLALSLNQNLAQNIAENISESPKSRNYFPPANLNEQCCNAILNKKANNATTLLSTVMVEVLDAQGEYKTIRGILDSGSSISFLSQNCANMLGLPRTQNSTNIEGIGETSLNSKLGSVYLTLRPVDKNCPILNAQAVILPRICTNIPSGIISIESWSHIKNVPLADPTFYKPGSIQILIGADLFADIIQDGRIFGNNSNEPMLLNTVFGYIIMGKIDSNYTPKFNSYLSQISYKTLNENIVKFWELEKIPQKTFLSPEEELCEQIFLDSVSRDSTGRYTVALPFKEKVEPTFPGSKQLALNRFFSLERKLLRNPDLYQKYSDFIREFLELDHMEILQNPDNSDKNFYIPHLCVERPESISTKLRVVFNASAKGPGSPLSLNETLLVGPKLQTDICVILLNFRLHKIAFIADMSKMYRQIVVKQAHQCYQRILWRFHPDDPIMECQLKRVTYGLAPSSYLSIRVLQHLADCERHNYDLASKVLLNDIFVDDISSGGDNLRDAIKLRDQLISLLQSGGFNLHKWASNDPRFLQGLPEESINPTALKFDSDDLTKVLGLQWQPSSDYFTFNVQPQERHCTKRQILSELATFFDPLGMVSPITFFTKCLIQKLWIKGLHWDDHAPTEISQVWNRYKAELPFLKEFKLHRHINIFSGNASYEIHSFADASTLGFASVCYLRICYENEILVYFLCSKTRVAPTKNILSIARLELSAALLAAQLATFVYEAFSSRLKINKIFGWSDSTVTLCWIKGHPSRWKTFVSNRVSMIQDKISPDSWKYVPTALNPADVASRGAFPSELLNHELFYKGPDFLGKKPEQWPAQRSCFGSNEVQTEEKATTVFFTINKDECYLEHILNKFSNFATMCRVLTYFFRFLWNYFKPKNERITGALTFVEINKALLRLIKYVQELNFPDEVKKLKNNERLSKPLQKLNLFLDSDNIIRVGGRLHYSSLAYDKKHPILLPRNSKLTYKIIESIHIKYFHAGLLTVNHLLNQRYWVLSPKRAITHVLSKCVRCFKVKPQPLQPLMGSLPSPRLEQCRAFTSAGVDFGGPFEISLGKTVGKTRAVKTGRAYVCLFVCLATKALHLELVSDLTAEAFVAALRRLFARRGKVHHMWSDNATNFVLANKTLFKLDPLNPVEWHFIPPSSPNFGGLWEAGIKSVKKHLIRVIGEQILTYEEFYTFLCQIEAILNSRPLTPLSSDPNDLSVLTPNHFLTLESPASPPDPDLSHLKLNKLSRWQLVQRLQQDFWHRYKLEYLHTLQQRHKWSQDNEMPSVGTLVLIKEDCMPPLRWKLGRITALHPGKDGIPRVATLKTATNAALKRPLLKLCPLPLENSENA